MFLFIAVKLGCSLGTGGAGFFRQDNISLAALVFSPPVLFAKNSLIDPHVRISVGLQPQCNNILHKKISVASKLGPRCCCACLLARGILWILYVFKCCIFSTCILPGGRLEAEEAFSSEVKSSSLSNWRTFLTCSITGAKCPSDGKTLEKCRNANGYFSSMID